MSSLLLFGISPTFSYFSTKFLLFPTFWLLKVKFLPIFCDFLGILKLVYDFIPKICNFLVDFEDFGQFQEKNGENVSDEILEPCSVVGNCKQSQTAAKM